MLPDFRKSVAFWKVPRLRPFVLLVRAACRWRRVWSIGGKVLPGETRSTRRNACFITTFPTTKSHTGSNPGRRGERPVTNCPSHNGLLEMKIVANYVQKFSPHCALNTLRLGYTDESILWREIIIVFSEIHTKRKSAIFERNVEGFTFNLMCIK
jgi:hypothetical protein